MTLIDSSVTGNQASDGAGLHNGDGGTMRVLRSTISGNTGGIVGGIENRAELNTAPASLTVIDSTISGNTGGGVLSAPGNPATLWGDTITANTRSAQNTFGAIGGSPVTVTNTLVAANPGLSDCYGTIAAGPGGHNLIGVVDGGCHFKAGTSTGNLLGTPSRPLDSKLGALADNGGPTRTHKLLDGSPAIRTGDAMTCADPATVAGVDQREYQRPSGSCDIGAYDSKGLNQPPSA